MAVFQAEYFVFIFYDYFKSPVKMNSIPTKVNTKWLLLFKCDQISRFLRKYSIGKVPWEVNVFIKVQICRQNIIQQILLPT